MQEQIEQAKGEGGMIVDESEESSDEEEEVSCETFDPSTTRALPTHFPITQGEFYTEGSDDLLEARRKIARYSLSKARARIARQRREYSVPLGKLVNARKELFKELKVRYATPFIASRHNLLIEPRNHVTVIQQLWLPIWR